MSETKISVGEVGTAIEYKGLTNREVRQLAMDIRTGAAFISWQLDDMSLLTMVFMPILFLNDIDRKVMARDGIKHLYGRMSDSAPRCINGYPMFFACGFLNVEDNDRVIASLKAIEQFMDSDDDD